MAPAEIVSMPVRVVIAILRNYQRFLSPLLGGQCRFYPTCSEYSRQALLRHGFIVGLALTCWRILRCQPLCQGGIEPVPQLKDKHNSS